MAINFSCTKLRFDMEQSESELENEVGKYFLSMGLFCQKFPKLRTHGKRKHNSPLELNGPPDLYIIFKSRFIGIEMKRPDGKQSDAQKVFEGHLRKAGGLYYICRSMDDAVNIYQAMREL